MADQLAKMVFDIDRVDDGTTQYEGITSFDPRVNHPELQAIRRGGNKLATEIHETAQDDFPVVCGVTTRDQLAMLPLLAASNGTWTITGKASDGGVVTVTISNGQWRRPRAQWNNRPSDLGQVSLELVAVSADGSALPITVAYA